MDHYHDELDFHVLMLPLEQASLDFMRIAYAAHLGYPISEPSKFLVVHRDVIELAHHNRLGIGFCLRWKNLYYIVSGPIFRPSASPAISSAIILAP